MAGEVADVVAVIRADTSDFDRGIRKAQDGVESATRATRDGEMEKGRALTTTAASLSRVRLGWLGVGAAAAGGLLAIIRQSNVANAQLKATVALLTGVSDQIVVGFGIDKLIADLNAALQRINEALAGAREKGEGSLPVGAYVGAVDKAQETAKMAKERGFNEGVTQGASAKTPPEAFAQGALGVGDVLLGIIQGAFGFSEAGIESIERGRGRFAGGGKDPPVGEMVLRVQSDLQSDVGLAQAIERYLEQKRMSSVGGILP